MKDKDKIQELFSKKLGNHEAIVRPDLWNGIASQITTASTMTAGVSVLTKIIISTVSIAAISTAVILFSLNTENEISDNSTKNTPKTIDLGKKEANFEEKTPISSVSENNTKEEIIEKQHSIVDQSPITKENSLDSSTVENENPTEVRSLKGVLKEREDVELISLNPSVSENEVIESNPKQEEVSNETIFPIEIEKEHLVEGYTITKLPDVFSPNNDGNNDVLFIESEGISGFSIVVMDESSHVLYKSSDPNFKWDGFDLYGNQVPVGRYIYFITGKDRSGNTVNKYQSLTIVR